MKKHSETMRYNETLRLINAINENLTKSPDYIYNGTFEPYEDADDYRRTIKAVRLA